MRRQRRKRSTRRRGLQHIGDVLSSILTDIDQDEAQEAKAETPGDNPGIPAGVTTVDPQNTFAFYQPAEV